MHRVKVSLGALILSHSDGQCLGHSKLGCLVGHCSQGLHGGYRELSNYLLDPSGSAPFRKNSQGSNWIGSKISVTGSGYSSGTATTSRAGAWTAAVVFQGVGLLSMLSCTRLKPMQTPCSSVWWCLWVLLGYSSLSRCPWLV